MSRILLGVVASLTLGFGVQTWRINSLQADLADATQLAKDEAKRANNSEALRTAEQAHAITSYSAASLRCDQRTEQARKAGAVIEEITNVRNTVMGQDAGSNSHRPIVTADQLRIIIGQGGTAQAVGLSAGIDSGASQ